MRKDNVRILEYKYEYQEEIIKFLINITTEEFGFKEWHDYFERKLVEKYQKGNNKFWVVFNEDNQVIGTCGALQESKEILKMNCFYINAEYRNLGIGKMLYELFLEFAKNANYKAIILCTYKEFDIAMKFYEKRGFKLYKREDDEFWYRKEI